MPDRQTIADVEARIERLATKWREAGSIGVRVTLLMPADQAADLTALLASHRKMRQALERVRDMRVNKEADTIWSAAARCRDIASSALQGDADAPR